MDLSELKNPYCIAGIIIFIIIIAMSIYYKFSNEHFAVEEITSKINNDLIQKINLELDQIKLPTDSTHIYSDYIEKLENKLQAKNINIIEAYPYIPLFGILLYNTTDSKLDKESFKSIIEIDLGTETNKDLIENNKNILIIKDILTDYIYLLVLYKNYVPDEYVNSSLDSRFIINEEYKIIYDAEYIQFMSDIKELDTAVYNLLIPIIFNYNKNIGDIYSGFKLGLTLDIINKYIDEVKNVTDTTLPSAKLSEIYINLNFIKEYLNSFINIIDEVNKNKDDIINIFTIMPQGDPTTGEAPTREAPTREAPSGDAPTREAPTGEAPTREAQVIV